jgi:four helix bundle protein
VPRGSGCLERGFEATLAVYGWTRRFPADERFGLSLQMRRAAASIPANIAEGFARRRPRDKARLYNIAEGSAEELSVFVRLATALGYSDRPEDVQKLVKDTAMMARRLTDVTLGRVDY